MENIFEHDQELQNSIQRSMSDYDFDLTLHTAKARIPRL